MKPVFSNKLHRNIQSLFANIMLRCQNEGCERVLAFQEMKDHERKCELNEPLLEQNEEQTSKQGQVIRQTLIQRIFGRGNRAP